MATPDNNDEFLKRLLTTFRLEAREHIDALYAGIAEMESQPEAASIAALVERVFREAHSLKGAARSVNQSAIEGICQSLESTFSSMKRGELESSSALFDNLQLTLNQLSALLTEEYAAAPSPPHAAQAAPAPASALPHKTAGESTVLGTTVRIATDQLDAIFLQAEEMLAAKLLIQQRRQELASMQNLAAAMHKEWSNFSSQYPDVQHTLAQQPQLQELLEQNAAFIKSLNHQLNAIAKSTEQDQRMIGRMVDELLEGMKKALMLPFSTVLEAFPRLVRDLAKQHGKDIDLAMHGEELEADRRILEAIKDPLTHIVRNAVDHGIEAPEARVRHHKPERGKIVITVQPYSGNRVEVAISDDGGGIDTDKVKTHAERLGLLSREEALSMDENGAMELIYHSGVSTSPIITEISGRGLGLAIVREKIDKLGGSVNVTTHPGNGTSFRILLPLTLATYRGITIRVGEQILVLPTSHVEQTSRVLKTDIRTAENRATVRINGTTFALVRMGDVLGIPHAEDAADPFIQMALLTASGKHIAFVVDEVLNEQEVLVKRLGRQLARVRNIAAATILGNGKAVPILNVSDLMKSAMLAPAAATARMTAQPQESPARQKHVLVVEDSITARSLIKGILELAGYRVSTAVDGVDGYTLLRNGEFDIVVSDVEMPRMDGFDLTAKIRGDKKLAELPVVLVTGLESREDRERGIDVGADAYIVKRSFEQSNLLEVMGRLV
ncbi:MAG: hybrid sensor histidine kinase/response regulator [Methylocystis sp.]|uniref:hybrid sensor histidine kinase/response regulator n=1 Tax=Methylocystis sp. TaxID=1911079 RepID=UPI003DA4E352